MIANIILGKNKYGYCNNIRDVSYSNDVFTQITTIQNVKIKNDVLDSIDLTLENPYRYNYLMIEGNEVIPFYAYYITDIKEVSSDHKVYRLILKPDVFSKQLVQYISRIHITKSKNPNYLHAPYPYTPIKQEKEIIKYEKIESILEGTLNNSYLFFFSFTETQGTISTIKYGAQLVYNAGGGDVLQFNENGNIVDSGVQSLFIYDLISGDWDEKLGLSPSQIKGAWIVKLPFNCVKVDNRIKLRINGFKNTQLKTHQYGNITHGYAVIDDLDRWILTTTLENPIKSDDFNSYVFVDEYENVTYKIPENYQISTITYRLNFSVTSLTIDVLLNSSNQYVSDNNIIGLKFSKLACSIAIGSNAWSDYINSGQRDYELELAKTNRDFQKNQAIAGTVTNVIGGAIAGASTGNPYAAVGAAAGAGVGSLISAYWMDGENRKQDARLQAIKDKNVKNQFSEIIASNDQVNKAMINFEFCILKLKASSAEIVAKQNEINRIGYDVDITLTDTTDIFNYFSNNEGIIKTDLIIFKDLNIPDKYIEELKLLFNNGFYNRGI